MVCGHEMNLCWSVQDRNPRQKGTVLSHLLPALTSSLLTANLIFWRNRVGGSLGALSQPWPWLCSVPKFVLTCVLTCEMLGGRGGVAEGSIPILILF